MVKFLALTGLRYGELVALQTNNLLENAISIDGTIHFHSTTYDSPIRTTPKTQAANRIVPLPEKANQILNKILAEIEFLKQNNHYMDKDYVFTHINGLPIDYRTFAPILKKAARDAGITKNVTSHYLRHTHVSILAELNVPVKAIMDRSGHSDASTTLEIYTHVTEQMSENLIDKLDSFDY
ncbi:tyrosine-type recombinase/integrase [Brochothrix campestris]|uniref:Integrase, superantigen-encoding pathogenicityislands SaPI n=1 Tax=Brochothrix campestris FSL F6-1037 TaxID=1265861 RepID=W7DA92_9LIST|nr:site-specific integrase [Brochothrix campestris]EUJ42183.1 Integrase, superantigen-encoding pathogenicityislands SaPI [Brochothrix campestris FSL F6-1037]